MEFAFELIADFILEYVVERISQLVGWLTKPWRAKLHKAIRKFSPERTRPGVWN